MRIDCVDGIRISGDIGFARGTGRLFGGCRFCRKKIGRNGLFPDRSFIRAVHCFVVEQQPIRVDLRETEQNFSQQIVSRFAASGDDMGDIGSTCPQNFRKAA